MARCVAKTSISNLRFSFRPGRSKISRNSATNAITHGFGGLKIFVLLQLHTHTRTHTHTHAHTHTHTHTHTMDRESKQEKWHEETKLQKKKKSKYGRGHYLSSILQTKGITAIKRPWP